jgi:hypothetical protein
MNSVLMMGMIAAALIMAIAFGSHFLENWYAAKAKKALDAATKKDAVLQSQENQKNAQADKLVQDAKNASADVNWYLKK